VEGNIENMSDTVNFPQLERSFNYMTTFENAIIFVKPFIAPSLDLGGIESRPSPTFLL
jgi:hypothetical protein